MDQTKLSVYQDCKEPYLGWLLFSANLKIVPLILLYMHTYCKRLGCNGFDVEQESVCKIVVPLK